MKVTGNVSDKEVKVLGVIGCDKSLKDLVDIPFRVAGVVTDTEKKTSPNGDEYQTCFAKLTVNDVTEWFKFTQTVVGKQLVDIIENDLANDIDWTVSYATSADGNRYLTIAMA